MTLTTFTFGALIALLLIIATHLTIVVMSLEDKIKELKQQQEFLDQELTDLTNRVHKNQYNIQHIQDINQQASVSKQLLKG
jgi:cell division protein FtsB